MLSVTAGPGTGLAVAGDRARLTALVSPERCAFQAPGQAVSLHPEQAAGAASIVSVGRQLGLPRRDPSA